MKFLTAASLAFASFACLATASPAPISGLSAASHNLRKRASNPTVSGLKFDIDGTTQYFAGTNSYWIGFLTVNADVDLVMSHLASTGLKVLRVWGFNDITSPTSGIWYQSFISGQSPQINTGTNGLQRLDYVVSSAAAHGIKLIINFVNNWSDYGGMAAYNTYYGTNTTTWYTDSRVQAQYQAYIKAVVSRYSNSTAVFAWELANEPRCHGCPTSIATNWITSTSAYIRSLDSTHMITTGEEGFMNGGGDGSYPYTTGEGMDFEANLKVPDISFGTFHLYPGSWGESDALGFGNGWITNHGAVCAAVGKPCILEEYGFSSNATIEGPWQTTALATNGIAGDMWWQYGDTLSSGQTSQDGNTIYYGTALYTTLVVDHIAAINGGSPPASSASTSTASSKVAVVSTSSSAPATPSSSGGTIAHWGQCGGLSWSGSGTCVAGTSCQVQNPYYSQCL